MAGEFQVSGTNAAALFTLKLHRGDGMLLIAMNWKKGKPSNDFVGFAIEYKEPGGDRFFPLKNRIAFPGVDGAVNRAQLSTMLSPIQKFRWVHFPRNADLKGAFVYRVTPVFMNSQDELSYGAPRRETYPGELNVCFTRGFVSSQAFVDHYAKFGSISKLIPNKADSGLKFKPTHPKKDEALAWMGFEAREAILDTLDQAIKDKADVRVIAYDFNEPEVVDRLLKVGKRLKVIIDDSKDHKKSTTAESQAERRLVASAGRSNVKRQHMSKLQHNKTIVVDGPKVKKVVCGSTNLSWRGFFVQNNNAMVLEGRDPVKLFIAAFENYWDHADTFRDSPSVKFTDLGLKGIDARVAFSPHSESNALLSKIGEDIGTKAMSCVFYSLAFLFETPGAVRDAITKVAKKKNVFVYGISDKRVGGIDLQKPDGNVAPVFASALTKTFRRLLARNQPGRLANLVAPACTTSSWSSTSTSRAPVSISVPTTSRILPTRKTARTCCWCAIDAW
jgi:hypothetical protein